MEDHQIMRRMAADYREQAERAEYGPQRARLRGFADYCEKMALAMEAREKNGKGMGGARLGAGHGAHRE